MSDLGGEWYEPKYGDGFARVYAPLVVGSVTLYWEWSWTLTTPNSSISGRCFATAAEAESACDAAAREYLGRKGNG